MMPHNKMLLYVCRSLVDQYFGGTFDCELKCTEAEDEPPSFSKENFLQLSCFISQDMRYMLSGLRSVSNRDGCLYNFYICIMNIVGFGGLGVACWPSVPKFAGSNPAEAVGFIGRKNPQHAFLWRGSKAVGPIS